MAHASLDFLCYTNGRRFLQAAAEVLHITKNMDSCKNTAWMCDHGIVNCSIMHAYYVPKNTSEHALAVTWQTLEKEAAYI
jgi:hypothetical protein